MHSREYERRIARVVDHIRENLQQELPLAELAKLACFSPFHFHRVFKGVTGETPNELVQRARLERALFLMRGAPSRELGSIALDAGFQTQSDFSRVFKKRYGIAPSSWDRQSRLDDLPDAAAHALQAGVTLSSKPRIVERKAARIMCVRVRDPWRHEQARLAAGYEQLTGWLESQHVDWRALSLVGLSWDSEKATPLEQLTYDLGFVVPEDATLSSGPQFALHPVRAVKAVEVPCSTLMEVAVAWEQLYRDWLPTSGYEPAHLPAMKRFRRTPERIDEHAWQVDCSVALQRAGAPQDW